jgi:hypothetical protein
MPATFRSRIFLSSRLPSTNINTKIYRTIIILPVVLYRPETWYLTLREKNVGCLGGRGRNNRLEKRGASGFVLLMKYYSGDHIGRMRWAGLVAHTVENKKA